MKPHRAAVNSKNLPLTVFIGITLSATFRTPTTSHLWTTQAVQKHMLENADFMTDFLNAGKDAGGYGHVKDPSEDLSCDFDQHAEGMCYLLEAGSVIDRVEQKVME